MDFDLSDDHELIRRTVRDFAEGEVKPVAEELDREKRFPYEIVEQLGALGLMGIPFPESYGGGGGDSLAYALAVEELTRVDSSVAITMCAHTSLGTQPIYLFGTEEQKQRYLPDLCAGRKLGAFGLTEPEAGSDAGNVRTRAKLDDDGWVIDGTKQFITNAGTDISGHVAITARTGDGEISNLIVENGTEGYSQGEPYRKMGWNASDTRPLAFEDCRVPEENLLGPRGQGFKQFLHILDIGRIGVAAMGVGLAQGALDEALAYAKERKAFGKPISKYQAIQAKLADISTEIEAARLLDLQGRQAQGPRPQLHADRGAGQAQDGPPGGARGRGGRADPRRLRLHRGVPRVPLLPRRQDPHDRRGHRRGAADGDRASPGRVIDPVLIANRGEIAVRIAATARRLGLSSVAVYTPVDAGAPHVDACDVAVEIGSYLDAHAVVEAARRAGARSVHPGYGFLSENAAFARAVVDAGLAWIGPPPEAIELMGDKARAKALAREAGVPVVPGVEGEDVSLDEVRAFASEHGYPVVIKAVAGGGGKGMRAVRDAAELEASLDAARREGKAAFGDSRVLVERYLERPRHIEIQVLADAHGSVVHLGERECSLQRRHQKVIEEAPSPVADDALRARMGEAAVALARACGYAGAGTVEFIAPADASAFFFLEMNTRLQVEHPVTELVYGVDLVEQQLRVAAGEPLALTQEALVPRGHAVEARLYAEDPANGFLPAVGTVRRYVEPAGVRMDSGIREGSVVGTDYDPMLAKVIAHADDRPAALRRLARALGELELLGVTTNAAFSRALLERDDVRAGEIDTGLLERILQERGQARSCRRPRTWCPPPRSPPPAPRARPGRSGCACRSTASCGSRTAPCAPASASGAPTCARPPAGACGWRSTGSRAPTRSRATATRSGSPATGTTSSCASRAPRAGAAHSEDSLEAPMPGTVLLVHATNGQEVEEGEVLVVIESMKMELSIAAPHGGTVQGLDVAVGDKVGLRQVLAEVVA